MTRKPGLIRKLIHSATATVCIAQTALAGVPAPNTSPALSRSLATRTDLVTNGLVQIGLNFPGSASWRSSGKNSFDTDRGRVEVQTLERIVDFGTVKIPVATVTHSVFSKTAKDKGQDFGPAAMADVLQKTLKLPTWTHHKQDGADVYEVDWRQQNRFFRVFYRDLGKKVSISVASIRRFYAVPVLLETELVQRRLAQAPKSGVASILDHFRFDPWSWLGVLGSKDAQADILSNLIPGLNLSTLDNAQIQQGVTQISNAAAQVPGAITSTGNQVTGAVNTFTGTVQNGINQFTTIGNNAVGAVNSAAGAGNNLAASINNAADAGRYAANTAQTISNQTNTNVRNIADQTNANLKNISDQTNANAKALVNKMTSFETAFVMGMGGAMGAMVGMAVLNLAVDGASWAVSSLYYSVIGRLDPETRNRMLKKGGKAWEDFERLSKDITEIEGQLDQQLAAMAFALSESQKRGMMMTGDYLAGQARRKYLDLDNRFKRNDNMLLNLNGNIREACLDTQDYVQGLSSMMKNIVPILNRSPDGLPSLCEQADRILRQWALLEGALHNAKQAILNNISMLIAESNNQFVEANTEEGSERRRRNECTRSLGKIESLSEDFAPSSVDSCIRDRYSKDKYAGSPQNPIYEQQVRTWCMGTQETQQSIATTINGLKTSCGNLETGMDSRWRQAEINRGLAYVQANISNAEAFRRELLQADCTPDSTDPTCMNRGNRPGLFAQMTQRYNTKLAVAQEMCKDFMPMQSSPIGGHNGGPARSVAAPAPLGSSPQGPNSSGGDSGSSFWDSSWNPVSWISGTWSYLFG